MGAGAAHPDGRLHTIRSPRPARRAAGALVLALLLGTALLVVPGASGASGASTAGACWTLPNGRVTSRYADPAVTRVMRSVLGSSRRAVCVTAVHQSRQQVTAAYRSSGPVRLGLITRDARGWRLVASGPALRATKAWRRTTWRPPALAAGTRALSVGILEGRRVRSRVRSLSVRAVAGSSTPAPVSTVTSAMPRRVAAAYWTNWGRNTPLDQLPEPYNVIFAAFAYGDGSGTGRAVFRPDDGSGVTAAQFADQVRHAQATGDKVVLSIGGANPVGLTLLTSEHVQQLVTSIDGIVDTYHLDGIDWDLEQQDRFTVPNLLSATRAWKARYGARFIVTATPAPASVPYKQFAQQAGDLLDYIAPQYYDYADADRLAGIRSRTQELVRSYGVPARKIGIGTEVGTDPMTAPATFWRDAVAAMRASYPDFAGASVWEATQEKSAGDPFATVVAPTALRP